MFPVESLPSSYYEERALNDAAERLAVQQRVALQQAPAKVQSKGQIQARGYATQPQQQQQEPRMASRPTQAQPLHLTQALLQRPPLSRPASSGFMGNIFQGFVRAASSSPSPPRSAETTPSLEKKEDAILKVSDEMERLIAERKRDADICAMPAWYH